MSPRITLLAFGTRGDVAPLTGVATALRDLLGADVAIAAQQPYREMITGTGFEYRFLPHDTEAQTRASTYGQAMVDGERLTPSKEALAGMRDDLAGVGEAMAAAGEDADVILCEGPVGALFGWHLGQATGTPSAALMLQPAYPTGDFMPPALGIRSLGRWGNRAAWRAGAAAGKVFAPLEDELRASLGLPPESRGDRRAQRAWTQLCGFSTTVVPRPADWPDSVHVTGYWCPAGQADYRPTPELEAFLADGPPPLYIGLGSTAISTGEDFSAMIRRAVRATGQRAIVHRGWAHLDGGDDPHILTVDDVPHDWLLPRTSAALHHCGAGTTAAVLRAGIPSIALPGIMDQPFWADRLHRLGCAPEPIRRTRADEDSLVRAINDVVRSADSDYHRAARGVASALARENGGAEVARIVEHLLTVRA